MLYINDFYSFVAGGIINKDSDLNNLQEVTQEMSYAIEPDYKGLIPPMQLRRMSKPIKLSIAAVKNILSEDESKPIAAINVGTAYGLLSDSETFLSQLVMQDEEMLTPTAFIQSTQNTIGGQLALVLNCTSHNMTFVQRGHSFEHALMDIELLDKNENANYIVGGVDEMTPHFYDIINKLMKKYDKNYSGNLALGEGATFFNVSHHPQKNTLCKITEYELFKAKTQDEVLKNVQHFITKHQIDNPQDINWIIGAINNNFYNHIYAPVIQKLSIKNITNYKTFTADYPTVAAAGLAFAVRYLDSHNKEKVIYLSNYLRYWSIFLLER